MDTTTNVYNALGQVITQTTPRQSGSTTAAGLFGQLHLGQTGNGET
ncbi:MAG: hypothetical protein KJP07_13245 [Desulfatitalea sp.]|nr:hypothetical protein [Desulfatitalea sp.]